MQQVAQRTSSKAVDFSFFFFSFRNVMTGFSLQVVLIILVGTSLLGCLTHGSQRRWREGEQQLHAAQAQRENKGEYEERELLRSNSLPGYHLSKK